MPSRICHTTDISLIGDTFPDERNVGRVANPGEQWSRKLACILRKTFSKCMQEHTMIHRRVGFVELDECPRTLNPPKKPTVSLRRHANPNPCPPYFRQLLKLVVSWADPSSNPVCSLPPTHHAPQHRSWPENRLFQDPSDQGKEGGIFASKFQE